MAKIITMRIDEAVLDKFSQFAKIENRSLSNFIETATLKYINDIEFVDDFEMKDILGDKKLVAKLRKGFERRQSDERKFCQSIGYSKLNNSNRILKNFLKRLSNYWKIKS